jgi:3'(2'), 5'-bisphosphate nucleotidase
MIRKKDYLEITEIFRYASEKASKKINEIYKSKFSITRKQDDSPLTIADLESNKIILNIIKKKLRKIPIVSEESEKPKGAPFSEFILVDPLDGTKEFVNKNDEFTVNIALIQNKKPKIGVVEIPAKNIQYFTDGENSYKASNKKIKRISVKGHDKPIFTISRSHLDKITIDFLKIFKIKKTIKRGSSLKFCLIAEGLADFYLRYGKTMEWDTAAGHAILKSAGGDVYNSQLSSLKYEKKDFLNTSFLAFNMPNQKVFENFIKFNNF